MIEPRAQYSCDTCRSRKVGCSRNPSGCERCKAEGIVCSYSRTGVIRRNRRQRDSTTSNSLPARPPGTPVNIGHGRALREPPDDIRDITTEQRLQRLMGGRYHPSLGELAKVLEEHSAAWQGSAAFDRLAEDATEEYFSFEEDQARAWVDELTVILQREKLLLTPIPSEVTDHLVASRPRKIPDRAWLVMFYSVALSVVSSSDTPDESTKAKLRSNLWLAFNDVRLLLEPTMLSVLALVVMACYVEEFMTPSICWALISKACVMLQALGVASWRVDKTTRERRTVLFWRLNYLDKALGFVLCRPPTIHRAMATGIALPTLEQLLPSRSLTPDGMPVLFEAHYTNQMHVLSLVMDDIWHCVYGQEGDKAQMVKQSLESWHNRATEVLDAAALTERPLLNAIGTESVETALQTLHFQYYSLLLLLTVSSREGRSQSTQSAQNMLRLLPNLGDMKPSTQEPFRCLLWQRLHCPSTAFGSLWGEIVTKGRTHPEQCKQSLEAMRHLPTYLGKMRSRNTLAAKLEDITTRFVEYATTLLYSQEDEVTQDISTSEVSRQEASIPRKSEGEELSQQANQSTAFMTPASMTNTAITSGTEFSDVQMDGQLSWPDETFSDPTFDWFAWFNQQVS